jgi:hypothetical protein
MKKANKQLYLIHIHAVTRIKSLQHGSHARGSNYSPPGIIIHRKKRCSAIIEPTFSLQKSEIDLLFLTSVITYTYMIYDYIYYYTQYHILSYTYVTIYYISVCVYIHIYPYKYMYIYIHTQTQTHTHLYMHLI